jgi:tetratricopeptide (TPR) repeat protein
MISANVIVAGMRPLSFIALLLMLAPSTALAQSDQDWKICRAEDADAALPACTRLIETANLDPKDRSAALTGRATAYARKCDFDHAIADADEAIKLDPKNSNAFMRRGASYAGKGYHDRAFADADRAIELDPNNFEAHCNRAGLFGLKGDYDRALTEINKAIEINPEFACAYISRANIHLHTGNFEQAVADASSAIEIDPKHAVGYDIRSYAYYRMHDYVRTISDATKAIEINPALAGPYAKRGAAYWLKTDLDSAIADYTKAAELEPKRRWPLQQLGLPRFAKGDFKAAADDLSRALQIRSDPSTVLFRYLARAHAGEREAAETELAEIARSATIQIRVWPCAVTELYLGKRSPEDMLAAARTVSARCTTQFFVGEWHALRSQSAEARAALSRAVEICPEGSVDYKAASAELARLQP